jgi:hypothetical protein
MRRHNLYAGLDFSKYDFDFIADLGCWPLARGIADVFVGRGKHNRQRFFRLGIYCSNVFDFGFGRDRGQRGVFPFYLKDFFIYRPAYKGLTKNKFCDNI